MVSKLVIIGLLAVVCLHYSHGAPRDLSSMSQKDLAEKFSEFLHDEKEMDAITKMAVRDGIPLGNGIRGGVRTKRQTAPESRESAEDMPLVPAGANGKGDGFFDRAANFVVEVLQRFLRWINTE